MPEKHGLNGRRVAGQSFLRGYLRHMGEGGVSFLADTVTAVQEARALVEEVSPGRPVHIRSGTDGGMRGGGVMYYPAVSFLGRAWARMVYGHTQWSICGITHTTATVGAMNEISAMMNGPVAPWDAVICTSRAVEASVNYQLDLTAEYQRRRFGPGTVGPRVMTRRIPLGIDTASFAPDPQAGAKLRQTLGLGPDDILCMVLSRLLPWGKFDPLPLYQSLQKAAGLTGRKLHLALVGRFDIGTRPEDFLSPARLMPDVKLHILNGEDADLRKGSLSGADMFLFPIDNIQETFGIAPIEAMASGLPVIATDWDGLRDTVSDDVGFRIPTVSGNSDHSRLDGLRYLQNIDNELQYQGLAAEMTSYDTDVMARCVAQLANDPQLRQKMGQAGQARARALYDWAAIIPQMQDLWAEQNQLREAAARNEAEANRYAKLEVPTLPSAFANFAAWPSRQVATGRISLQALPATGLPSIAEVFALRRQTDFKRQLDSTSRFEKVLQALRAAPGSLTTPELAQSLGMPLLAVERIGLWLVKYGFARFA